MAESLPAGPGEDWLCWRALNRLRTGVGRAKTVMRRWGYLDDAQSVDCDCGEPQTVAHLLSCRLLDEACTAVDLATVTYRAHASGRTLCEGHERRRRHECYDSCRQVSIIIFLQRWLRHPFVQPNEVISLQAFGIGGRESNPGINNRPSRCIHPM